MPGDKDGQEEFQDDQMNGTNENGASGDNPADSGSAEAPGKDDDRYLNAKLLPKMSKFTKL